MRARKLSFRKLFKILITPFVSVIGVFLFSLLISQSMDAKLDYLAYKVNDYNNVVPATGFVSPILSVRKNDNTDDLMYRELYNTFSYTTKVNGFRQQVSNVCTISQLDDKEIKFECQWTYSIEEKKNSYGTYYLDGGKFSALFNSEYLENRQYLSTRFNCDTYVFISTSFANELINKYGLPEGDYESLILKEQYCVIDICIDGETTVKACINNVMSEDKTAYEKKCTELFGGFGFIYLNYKIKNFFTCEFEVDLKCSPHSFRYVANSIFDFGYNYKNSNLIIKKYSKDYGKYIENTKFSESLNEISKIDNDFPLFIGGFAVFVIELAGLIVLSHFKQYQAFLSLLISLIMGILFFAITGFTYCYYLIPLMVLINLCVIIFSQGKEAADVFKQNKDNSIRRNEIEFEIKI